MHQPAPPSSGRDRCVQAACRAVAQKSSAIGAVAVACTEEAVETPPTARLFAVDAFGLGVEVRLILRRRIGVGGTGIGLSHCSLIEEIGRVGAFAEVVSASALCSLIGVEFPKVRRELVDGELRSFVAAEQRGKTAATDRLEIQLAGFIGV